MTRRNPQQVKSWWLLYNLSQAIWHMWFQPMHGDTQLVNSLLQLASALCGIALPNSLKRKKQVSAPLPWHVDCNAVLSSFVSSFRAWCEKERIKGCFQILLSLLLPFLKLCQSHQWVPWQTWQVWIGCNLMRSALAVVWISQEWSCWSPYSITKLGEVGAAC